MHRQYNEDLFEHTKMTFGEHLDELRRSLLKAVLSLVIGVAVGFLVAKDVVKYVQTPLKSALKVHYSALDQQRYRDYLIRERERGGPVPKDLEAAVKAFAEEGLVLDERLINPRELADILNNVAPGRS